jgi:hypothetical protein
MSLDRIQRTQRGFEQLGFTPMPLSIDVNGAYVFCDFPGFGIGFNMNEDASDDEVMDNCRFVIRHFQLRSVQKTTDKQHI